MLQHVGSTSADPADLVREVQQQLEAGGLRRVLRYLNARTRHRFTGAYVFEPPMLRSVSLFDRENPDIMVGELAPLDETYCSLVGARASAFRTDDAPRDERLALHPARQSIQAYCGAPLVNGEGACFGSLCHFDVRPRVVPVQEATTLLVVAPLVAAEVERMWRAKVS
ncbi:MAG: luxQ 8 [Gemmatimonadetes bacterium]|nr:luxQ 8 [Gemmatimonadota bacterium]